MKITSCLRQNHLKATGTLHSATQRRAGLCCSKNKSISTREECLSCSALACCGCSWLPLASVRVALSMGPQLPLTAEGWPCASCDWQGGQSEERWRDEQLGNPFLGPCVIPHVALSTPETFQRTNSVFSFFNGIQHGYQSNPSSEQSSSTGRRPWTASVKPLWEVYFVLVERASWWRGGIPYLSG